MEPEFKFDIMFKENKFKENKIVLIIGDSCKLLLERFKDYENINNHDELDKIIKKGMENNRNGNKENGKGIIINLDKFKFSNSFRTLIFSHRHYYIDVIFLISEFINNLPDCIRLNIDYVFCNNFNNELNLYNIFVKWVDSYLQFKDICDKIKNDDGYLVIYDKCYYYKIEKYGGKSAMLRC
jgi:hypothetical protein